MSSDDKHLVVPELVFKKLVDEVVTVTEPIYDNPVQPFEQYKKALQVELEALGQRLFERIKKACVIIKEECAPK